jgi:hypothetical protein
MSLHFFRGVRLGDAIGILTPNPKGSESFPFNHPPQNDGTYSFFHFPKPAQPIARGDLGRTFFFADCPSPLGFNGKR